MCVYVLYSDLLEWFHLCVFWQILKKSPVILFLWLFYLQNVTGWFSFHTIDCLRRRIDVRFMSVCPHPRAESLLNSMSTRFEKSKRTHTYVKVARPEEQEKTNKGLKQSVLFVVYFINFNYWHNYLSGNLIVNVINFRIFGNF